MRFKRFTLFVMMLLVFMTSFPMAVYAAQRTKHKITPEIDAYLKKWNYPDISFDYENLENGHRLYYNKGRGYYPCCTIKVKGILNLYDKIRSGEYDENKTFTYTAADYAKGSGIIVKKGIGKQYTLARLAEYAISYSDNAAYIMTQRYMGRNIINVTGPDERSITTEEAAGFLKRLYEFLQVKDKYTKDLTKYFTTAIYKDAIPAGLSKTYKVLNKVGDWPDYGMNHDIALVLSDSPYVLAVYTKDMGRESRSEAFMAGLAEIIDKENESYVSKSEKAIIKRSREYGLISADNDSSVKTKKITEKTFIRLLVKLMENEEEIELPKGNYLKKANEAGIIDREEFKPKAKITKEKAVKYLLNAYEALPGLRVNDEEGTDEDTDIQDEEDTDASDKNEDEIKEKKKAFKRDEKAYKKIVDLSDIGKEFRKVIKSALKKKIIEVPADNYFRGKMELNAVKSIEMIEKMLERANED